jgi:outer membrane protein, heavy metal efflux system
MQRGWFLQGIIPGIFLVFTYVLPVFGVESPGSLTFNEVMEEALKMSPILSAAKAKIGVSEGELEQVGLFPNPRLGISREDFGGRNPESPKVVYEIEQPIPWKGLRAKQIEAARLDAEKEVLDYKIARLNINAELRSAFFLLLGAQYQVKLEAEVIEVANQLLKIVSVRAEAGKVSPVEISKAKVILASSILSQREVTANQEKSLMALAILMGQIEPQFQEVQGQLEPIQAPPALGDLKTQLQKSPILARWTLAIRAQKARLEATRISRRPEISLRAGTTHFEDAGKNGYGIGVNLEIPVFDRKQGELKSQEAALSYLIASSDQATLEAHRELALRHKLVDTQYQNQVVLKNEILPTAKLTLDSVLEGYRLGKLGYLDVLDAQRTWVQTRKKHLEVLIAYHQAHSDLLRLIDPLDKNEGRNNHE